MRRSLAVLLSIVAVVGLHPTAAVAAAEHGTVVHTWFTGTIEPGGSKNGQWLNIRSDHAYDVSLSPVGASTSEACNFRVDRVWTEQRPEGNRDLKYTIQNFGRVACAATVMVYRIPATKIRSSGGIDPGTTKTFTESSVDDTKVYRVGMLPSGATMSQRCKLEVTRLWYTHRTQGSGATVFDLTYSVKNAGDIACQGDVLLGSAPIEHSMSFGPIAPEGWSGLGLDASPETAYVPGVLPNLGCTVDLWAKDHLQWITRTGSVDREVFLSVQNRGSTSCSGKFTMASI